MSTMSTKMSVAADFENLKKSFKFPFGKLKQKQERVIQTVIKGKDCFAIFPTGYGKTIMYVLPALLKKQYSFVVSPLRALMADQIRNLKEIGVQAISLGPGISPEEKKGLQDGQYQVVMFPPEVLQQLDRWRFFIESKVYEDSVAVIAVDEVHLLQSWGEEFRPAFNRIAELKSFFTASPLLLLSATCTAAARTAIIEKLQLPKDLHIEWEVPDRPNIHISIISESGMENSLLNWYLDMLKEQGAQTEKAVIYVSGISQMSKLAVDFMGFLGKHAYTGSEKKMIFKMFHSGMERGDLESILEEFSKPDSTVRMLVCTIAFGIGVNIPDIRYVLHWGCCKSVEDYWQELGRAGRDSLPAKGIMYATKHSLINVEQSMKDIVLGTVRDMKCTNIKIKMIFCL